MLDKDTISHILFSEHRWMPLTDRIDYHRSTQVYKCLNNIDNQDLSELFQYNKYVHNHSTGTHGTRSSKSNNLHVQRCHKKSFAFKGVKYWNKIPDNIKTVSSFTSFEKLYTEHYFSS